MHQLRIMHFADIHFDTPFSELSVTAAEQRKEEVRETFGKIITEAKNNNIDVILIAGDVFDNVTVMKTTLDLIIRKFSEIPDIKVFIAPGNHDPYNIKSFYHLVPWPENVYIFKERYEAIELREFNTIIHGIGFSVNHISSSMLKGIEARDKDKINIMVMHGELSSNGSNDYNPFTLEEIAASKMDYIALGHRHGFSGILREKDTYYAYSGNIEGRGFDEIGEKGVILGTIAKHSLDLSFKAMQKRRYFHEEIDVTGCTTYEEVCRKIIETFGDTGKDNLFKIILRGELPEYFHLNLELLASKLKDNFYFLKLKDETTVEINAMSITDSFTLKGIYAKRLLKAVEEAKDEDRELYNEALKLGLKVLSGGEITLK